MTALLRNKYLIGIIGIVFIAIALLADTWLHPLLYGSYAKGRAASVQSTLLEREKEADSFLRSSAKIPVNQLQESFEKLYNQSREKHLLFYITRLNGSIIYYSNNAVFPAKIINPAIDSELQHLPNGYYVQKNIAANGVVFIALIPVQYKYAIENQYLQNYMPFLRDNNDFNLSINNKEGYPVYNSQHKYLFSLSPKKIVEPFNWVAFLFAIGFVFLCISVDKLIMLLLRRKLRLLAILTFCSLNIVFIFFWKIMRLPADMYRWPSFSSHYYGSSSLFSSLGDLLFFSCLLFCFFRFLSQMRLKLPAKQLLAQGFLIVLIMASFFMSAQVTNLVNSLVLDSIIPFDLGNIFTLNFYSIIGIVVIFIFIGSYFAFLRLFARYLKQYFNPPLNFFLVLSISMFVSATLMSFTPVSFYIAFLFNVICLSAYYYKTKLFRKSQTFFSLSLMAFSSLFISIILSKYNEQKQNDEQQTIASNVITERDPVAEYLFTNIYDEIQDDNYVKDYFRAPMVTQQVLENRIQQVYLSGYFSKYDIDVSTFTIDGLPFKNPVDKPLSYYTNVLEKEGAPELPNNLFYLHRHTGLPTYISKILVSNDAGDLGIILIQMQQKPFYEESVYPELLLSENLRKFKDLDKYSYAVYSNGILLNQKGEYPYPGVQNLKLRLDSNNSGGYKDGGYTHLVNQPHANLLVIVSIKSPGLLYYVSSFAFVFLFMAVGFLISVYLPYTYRIIRVLLFRKGFTFKNNISFKKLSFRNKILITVISGMTISMLLIGFVTVSYIIYQYNKDELDKLRKKTRMISTRMSNDFQQNERQLVMVGADMRLMVKTLSDMYQADINVFDVKGNLVSSTESAIYDKQIIAPKMDALANLKFNADLVSQVIQEERIGKLKFTSCYMPIRNSIGQVIGYLNLPYFSKEQELKNRISSFLEALVNLYLLLFLLLVMLGVFMTRVLTSPLDIIRNHLKNTSLSGSNEFIAWNTNDEIGKLVKEYNSMILALKESAERLAQSEREDTLKELAQHVAHEIKNPLTPMKLGIQQLQNAYYDQSKDYNVLFKKVTTMIIRQIDTLSAIATDFNASAKQGNPGTVNINSLLLQVSELFSHNLNANIRLDLDNRSESIVYADPNKLTRVFTNLVNNALQAIPENKEGIINITSSSDEDNVKISIEDNGSGIAEALRKKIFVPNFSTKSSGTGLGLAISKAIVEQAGGKISFTSVEGHGSTFIIILPLYGENREKI